MTKVKNNLLWRHPFAYGITSYVIAMSLFVFSVKLNNFLLAVVACIFSAMFIDGYIRDHLFIWKCPNCGWKPEYERPKHCIYCGTKMSAFSKVEKRCPKCGKVIKDNWLYCANCGYEIRKEE